VIEVSHALSRPGVIATASSDAGIAATYAHWQASGLPSGERAAFYREVLERAIAGLGSDLRGAPVIVSGMASSSIGMLELPYHPLPLDVSGVGLQPALLPPTAASPRSLYLVPGVRSTNDVMRGEETQLIGCGVREPGERMLLFPGTHSKHILVRNGRALDLRTYMTGEVFGLLARRSILAGSVAGPEAAARSSAAADAVTGLPEAFFAGLSGSRESGVLHNAFLTRTNELFGRYSKEDNYHFLSGLLIGEELRELVPGDRPVTLVASSPLRELYGAALAFLGFGNVPVIDADQALTAGHCVLFERLGATIAP